MTEDIEQKIAGLEAQMTASDFWTDKARAQVVIEEYNRLKLQASGSGEHDAGEAIITIFSGAGGDDAEDFSRLLYEMYEKFAARRGFELYLVHQHRNDHGGYRNLTFEVRGPSAYGILKNESGVHRLVRVSPFSAKKLRHTSFSLVEVVPKLTKHDNIDLNPSELKVEFSRSSGPGGQNVNKRETAARMTHLPTGLTAHSDSERSQERNKDKALAILKAKLYRREEEARLTEAKGLAISTNTDIEWGSQIRSYVLHPYQMVKDHRTGVTTSQVDEVLAGDLDAFIEAEAKLK